MAYVYILECADGTYYTGATIDLDRRLKQHQKGIGAKYTRGRRPLKLLCAEHHPSLNLAYQRESEIKSWTRTKKKAMVIKLIKKEKV